MQPAHPSLAELAERHSSDTLSEADAATLAGSLRPAAALRARVAADRESGPHAPASTPRGGRVATIPAPNTDSSAPRREKNRGVQGGVLDAHSVKEALRTLTRPWHTGMHGQPVPAGVPLTAAELTQARELTAELEARETATLAERVDRMAAEVRELELELRTSRLQAGTFLDGRARTAALELEALGRKLGGRW